MVYCLQFLLGQESFFLIFGKEATCMLTEKLYVEYFKCNADWELVCMQLRSSILVVTFIAYLGGFLFFFFVLIFSIIVAFWDIRRRGKFQENLWNRNTVDAIWCFLLELEIKREKIICTRACTNGWYWVTLVQQTGENCI